ncbi:MAG: dihydroorotate dehydrogenase electron transfer subunit [Bacteroidales bacterium]|nr:dihydroorotate dehydrogenase electron transfer subunit [Bacteroidales bacterium]MBR4146760.1 dihydroorotate dehydrogenase electron transfer subunit [Bacteroidales bacterium]
MKRITDFELIEKEDFGNAVLLRLRSQEPLPDIEPGQFAQVQINDSPTTYLRRPISIHDVDRDRREISLLIQKVGEGTRHLAALECGSTVNMVYPLGHGYTMPSVTEKVLLVGGGVGIAPLFYLAKRMAQLGVKPALLLCGKTKGDLPRLEEYQKVGEVYVTTEDGSCGEKGITTAHSLWKELQFDRLYVCGPKRMMHAVADIAKIRDIECEVSLENLMACGLGACLCCVEDTVDGHVCVCKEGPVFNIRRLKW